MSTLLTKFCVSRINLVSGLGIFHSQFGRMASKQAPKVMFVLGAPGSGKGTQCQLLCQEYGFVHISAGDLLREERANPNSEYGTLIDNYIKEGKIVPVDITCALLEKQILSSGPKRFLIDGFPRNQDNLDGWKRRVAEKVDLLFVLFLDCPMDVCTERCLQRGAAGSGRTDDNEESIKKRFTTFYNETRPVVDFYSTNGMCRSVDANKPRDEVFQVIKQHLDEILGDAK